MKYIVLSLALLIGGCSEPKTSTSTEPDSIQIQVRDSNGNVAWKCIEVGGGGTINMAIPAYIAMWTPVANKCFKNNK